MTVPASPDPMTNPDAVLDDFILCVPGAMSTDLSAALVSEFAYDPGWTEAGLGDGGTRRDVRRCQTLVLRARDDRSDSLRRRALVDAVETLVFDLAARYDRVITPTGVTAHNGIGFIRYAEGGHYLAHQDFTPDEARTLSISIVLPTEYTGGALSFFGGDVVADAGPGDACVFPASFLFPHAVQPVSSGVRYSIVTWMR